MAVNLLIITHEDIGRSLLCALQTTLENLPLFVTLYPVKYGVEPEVLAQDLKKTVDFLDQNQGILVLTDLYGSTPFNIAKTLLSTDKVKIVSGLNLPMLIRIMNYPDLSLAELAQKAISGGKDGIIGTCIAYD